MLSRSSLWHSPSACPSGKRIECLAKRPTFQINRKSENNHLRIACASRLGAPVCHTHKCRCGYTADGSGLHGLSCAKTFASGRQYRHRALNDTIKRSLIAANIPAILEPNGLSRDDQKQPDGMSLVPVKDGRCLVWDATCVDTLCVSHLASSLANPGAAANNAEADKFTHYTDIMQRYDFRPVGFETFGPAGKEAKKLLNFIGKRLTVSTGEKRSTQFLWQRCSIEIQRGNAISVLATIPYSRGLDEIFYLLQPSFVFWIRCCLSMNASSK